MTSVLHMACVFALAVAEVAAPGIATGEEMSSFSRSSVWKSYQQVYAQLDSASSAKRADALAEKLPALAARLGKALEGKDELASQLMSVLNDQLALKKRLYRPTRDEPHVDRKRELSVEIASLQHATAALHSLSAALPQDAWVEATLVPKVKLGVEIVEGRTRGLTSTLGEAGAKPLAAEAAAAVKAAREELAQHQTAH